MNTTEQKLTMQKSVERILKDLIEHAESGRLDTAWSEPCIVVVYGCGQILATGMGMRTCSSSDLGDYGISYRLDTVRLGEMFDPGLNRFANRDVSPCELEGYRICCS